MDHIQVRLGYKNYSIEFIDNPMGDKDGLCRVARGKIYIDEDLDPDEKLNTIIHELLHAIHYTYGLKKPDEDEEHDVRILANGITDVVLRNPQLLKRLQEIASE